MAKISARNKGKKNIKNKKKRKKETKELNVRTAHQTIQIPSKWFLILQVVVLVDIQSQRLELSLKKPKTNVALHFKSRVVCLKPAKYS